MAKNNYPQGQLDDMEPSAVQGLVTSLRELYERGKPETDEEVRQRIDEYFEFCERSSIRPGIESACMALHVGRTTFYNWSKGVGCSEKRQEYVEAAKGFISAYIEQALLSGKISPPSGNFLCKNWLGYKDSVSVEEATVIPVTTLTRTPEQIAASYGIEYNPDKPLSLPEIPD